MTGQRLGAMLLAVLVMGPAAAPAPPSYPPIEESSPAVRRGGSPEDRNAAVAYALAMYQARAPSLANEWHDLASGFQSAATEPAAEALAAAPTLWFANADLVAASRLERCDWQSSVELGVRCSLPHTYVMGDVLQLLVVQGFACEEIDGDVDTALISWAAALRAAEHLASGGTFVESRIAMRWAQRIVAIVEQRIDFEDVSAESLTDWSHALGRFDAEDPFGTLLAIERAVEWGVRISALDVLEAERIEQNGLVGYSFDDTPVLPRSDAEAEKLRRLTIAARPWKAAMREAWLRPSGDLGDDHAAAERAAGFVNAVTAEARSGEFGDAGRLMLVNDYGAVRSEELRATRSIGRARAAVRKARAE